MPTPNNDPLLLMARAIIAMLSATRDLLATNPQLQNYHKRTLDTVTNNLILYLNASDPTTTTKESTTTP
jgi:hypothetical protein